MNIEVAQEIKKSVLSGRRGSGRRKRGRSTTTERPASRRKGDEAQVKTMVVAHPEFFMVPPPLKQVYDEG